MVLKPPGPSLGGATNGTSQESCSFGLHLKCTLAQAEGGDAQSNPASRDGPEPAIQNQEAQELPSGVTNQSFPEEHHATLDGVASAPRSSKLLQGSFFERWRTTFQEQSTPENGFRMPECFLKSKGQFGPFNSNRSLHIYVLIGTLPQDRVPF